MTEIVISTFAGAFTAALGVGDLESGKAVCRSAPLAAVGRVVVFVALALPGMVGSPYARTAAGADPTQARDDPVALFGELIVGASTTTVGSRLTNASGI